MQKKHFAWLLAVIALLFCFTRQTTAQAKTTNYQINNNQINVYLKKNGNAKVVQTVSYQLNANRLYLALPLNITGASSMPKISVSQNNKKLKQSDSHQRRTFTKTQTKNMVNIVSYGNYKKGTVTLKYTYTLNHLAINYKDCASINWSLITKKMGIQPKKVSVKFILPQKNVKFLRLWHHGNVGDTNTIVNNTKGTAQITSTNNPAKFSLRLRLLMPVKVTSTNTNVIKRDTRELIERYEDEQAAKIKAQNEQKKTTLNLISYGLLILTTFSFVGWFIHLLRHPLKGKAVMPDVIATFAIPKLPAEFAEVIMTDKKPTPRAFAAYLLELAANKKVTIETVPNTRNDFSIKLADKSILHNNNLLKMLFGSVGSKGKFNLKDLENFSKDEKSRKLLAENFDQWAKVTFDRARKTNYFDVKANRSAHLTAIWCLANIPLTAACVCLFLNQLYIAIPVVLIMLLSGILLSKLYSKRETYTQKGIAMRYRLLCLNQGFATIKQTVLAPLKEQVLHEELVPYSIVFGSSRNTIQALKINFPAKRLQLVFEAYYFPVFIFSDGEYAAALSEGLVNAIAPKKAAELNTEDDKAVKFKKKLFNKLREQNQQK